MWLMGNLVVPAVRSYFRYAPMWFPKRIFWSIPATHFYGSGAAEPSFHHHDVIWRQTLHYNLGHARKAHSLFRRVGAQSNPLDLTSPCPGGHFYRRRGEHRLPLPLGLQTGWSIWESGGDRGDAGNVLLPRREHSTECEWQCASGQLRGVGPGRRPSACTQNWSSLVS